ncbi:MAG: hypothetical protein M3619_07040 [Myxococcota bacterium]|nr:hypothetical protein [Myxococcota bacterium]
MTVEPSAPDAERRNALLAVLGDLVARGGVASLLAPPIAPGVAAFPEPWRPSVSGVTALLRRLVWHAGGLGDRHVIVADELLGAPPTEHKPQTRVELTEVRQRALAFTLSFVGTDDVVGTLAHEVGVAHAILHRPDDADPYRSAEQPVIPVDLERDLERGSIATVYLGLGVIAANAAFQQYSSRIRTDAYAPHVYEVHRAGYVPMAELAYLLAVQAVVRGETTAPAGLAPPQRDEVLPWIAALVPRASELRARLGVPATAHPEPRPPVVRFDDVDVDDDAPRRRAAFRWQTHRGGLGMIAGVVFAAGIALAVVAPQHVLWCVLAGGGGGHLVGRRVRVARCSACVTVLDVRAETCRKCGLALRGDIARLADRLEAEERLEPSPSSPAPPA